MSPRGDRVIPRKFPEIRRPTLPGLTAAYALVLSALMGYGGVGHIIAVASVHLRSGRAYDFRFATLLATGGILLYGALTNLALARYLARGTDWAFAWSIAVTAAVTVYNALLLPLAAARDAAGPAFILNMLYVLWAGTAWIMMRRHRHSSAR